MHLVLARAGSSEVGTREDRLYVFASCLAVVNSTAAAVHLLPLALA